MKRQPFLLFLGDVFCRKPVSVLCVQQTSVKSVFGWVGVGGGGVFFGGEYMGGGRGQEKHRRKQSKGERGGKGDFSIFQREQCLSLSVSWRKKAAEEEGADSIILSGLSKGSPLLAFPPLVIVGGGFLESQPSFCGN